MTAGSAPSPSLDLPNLVRYQPQRAPSSVEQLVLEQTVLVPGRHPRMLLTMRNEGQLESARRRPVVLVLVARGRSRSVRFRTDRRACPPGSSVTMAVTVRRVPRGAYATYLALPATGGLPAVRLANRGTWDAVGKRNALHQTVVVAGFLPRIRAQLGLAPEPVLRWPERALTPGFRSAGLPRRLG